MHFSSRGGWTRKMENEVHKKCRQGKNDAFLADQSVISLVFGWFEGGLACLWVFLLVRGWFGWSVGRLAGLWVVLSFTANAKFYHAIQIILYMGLCDQSW